METDNETEKLIEPSVEPLVEPSVEPTISTPNEVIIKLDEQLLAIMQDSSNNFCKLTPKEIIFMTNLVKDASGSIIPQIQQTIEGILKDGSINLHEIPQLVLSITQIFQSNISVKNVNLLNLVQYTLDVLLESNILPIPPHLQSVAKHTIDTSLTLLNTTLPTVKVNCYSILSCLFHKRS